MLKLIIPFLIFCYPVLTNAQAVHDSAQSKRAINNELAQQLMKRGRSQIRAGSIIGITGSVASFTGMIIYMSGFSSGWDSNNSENAESKMNTGSVLMVTGLAMLGTGVTLCLVGRKKEKKGKLLLSTSKTMISQHSRNFSLGLAIHL